MSVNTSPIRFSGEHIIRNPDQQGDAIRIATSNGIDAKRLSSDYHAEMRGFGSVRVSPEQDTDFTALMTKNGIGTSLIVEG